MIRRYRYLHLDVFSGRRFGGNPLAVFPRAEGLSRDEMAAVTREINFSESTFVLPPERPDTDVRMRIFTPGAEMPMAGHPTVGSTFALALEGVIAAGTPRWVFGLNIGPTPVDIEWRDGEARFVWMTQNPPTFGEVLPDVGDVAHALGLDPAAIRETGLPVQEVSCGVPFVFVPLVSRAAVDAADPIRAELARLSASQGLDERAVFVFSTEPGDDDATVYSRMFAPGLGVFEDPATGSASGPLGCYLVRHRVVAAEQAGRFLSLQGVKMGRPSRVHIAIDGGPAEISGVRVGGEAVLVATGEFLLD